jgi:hypothetical protein
MQNDATLALTSFRKIRSYWYRLGRGSTEGEKTVNWRYYPTLIMSVARFILGEYTLDILYI